VQQERRHLLHRERRQPSCEWIRCGHLVWTMWTFSVSQEVHTAVLPRALSFRCHVCRCWKTRPAPMQAYFICNHRHISLTWRRRA
jgi:hypothetical protein